MLTNSDHASDRFGTDADRSARSPERGRRRRPHPCFELQVVPRSSARLLRCDQSDEYFYICNMFLQVNLKVSSIIWIMADARSRSADAASRPWAWTTGASCKGKRPSSRDRTCDVWTIHVPVPVRHGWETVAGGRDRRRQRRPLRGVAGRPRRVAVTTRGLANTGSVLAAPT
jgi:hypothetical protein